MGKNILEFCLGAFAGVIALMALAYMSVEVLGAGPVSLQQLAEEEPQILPAPIRPFDPDSTPIILMVEPQPIAVSELHP